MVREIQSGENWQACQRWFPEMATECAQILPDCGWRTFSGSVRLAWAGEQDMDRWRLTAKHILVCGYSISFIAPEYKKYICSKVPDVRGTEHMSSLLHFTLVSGKCVFYDYGSSTDNDLALK